MNRYEQFSDTEFEDAEEEASDDDDEDKTEETEGANQHKTRENDGKQITVSTEEKTDADAYPYDGDDFITEEEMQNKQNTADNTEGNKIEMVSVVTEIQKKRALSIKDNPTKSEAEKSEAEAERKWWSRIAQ